MALKIVLDLKYMKDNCDEAGAKKMFPAILFTMSLENLRIESYKTRKCVTMINILMFGHFQKASWCQMISLNQAISRSISDSVH